MDGRGVVENGENDVVEEGWRLIRTAVIILARIIQTALSPMREARRLRTSGVGDSVLTFYDVEWYIVGSCLSFFYFYRGSITLYRSFLRCIEIRSRVQKTGLIVMWAENGPTPKSNLVSSIETSSFLYSRQLTARPNPLPSILSRRQNTHSHWSKALIMNNRKTLGRPAGVSSFSLWFLI